MFAFGFLTLFILTQMHGVGLGRRSRTALVVLYLGVVMINYWGRGWEIVEVTRIPLAELGLAVLIAGAVWIALRLRRAST